jgi:type IV pilus assembly protein PilP
MNWRQPWLWPQTFQRVAFPIAGLLGALLLSPWWLQSWQLWDDAHQAQARWLQEQKTIQTLRVQTAQILKIQNSQPRASFASAAVLTDLAQQQGLQLSHLGLDKPQQTPVLNALHMQQLPVHLKVQGSWGAWLNWLAHWPQAAPGVTVSTLELQSDPQGGSSARVLAVAPQPMAEEAAFELSSVDTGTSVADPFSATGWTQAQRAHAELHPSYARWVAPELLRPREWLETLPRDRLQYVGQIASGREVEALVKVLPVAVAKQETQMMSVHRVRIGSYIGQNFGKVIAVEPDQLVLQELALTLKGEWEPRDVRMPLQGAAP